MIRVFLVIFCLPAVALSFPAQDEATPVAEAAEGEASFISRFDASYFDGKITTSPPDAVRSDQRAETLVKIGTDVKLTQTLGLRVIAKGQGIARLEQEDEEPKTFIEERYGYAYPTMAVTYMHTGGVELFAGANYFFYPGYDRTRIDSNGTTTWTYGDASLLQPYGGLIKRAAQWKGGFFYATSATSQRSYRRDTFEGVLDEAEEEIFVPVAFGFLADLKLSSWQVACELTIIEAKGLGIKDQDGHHLYEDHFQARLKVGHPLTAGVQGTFTAIHRSLAYAHQGAVQLDSIAMNNFRLGFELGGSVPTSHLALIYGEGRDGQSFDEFNAHYDFRAYGVSFGLRL